MILPKKSKKSDSFNLEVDSCEQSTAEYLRIGIVKPGVSSRTKKANKVRNKPRRK